MKPRLWAAAVAVATCAWLFSLGATAADFNGDGKADILWRQTSTGTVAMWMMNGGTMLSTPTVGSVPSDWVIQGLGDFNGDSQADIVWRQTSTGAVAMWMMNGGTMQSTPSLDTVPSDWVIQGVADFSGDGKADILWRQTSTGTVAMWMMNGGTIQSTTTLGSVPSDWVIQGAADFDGNGKADIVWRQTSTGVIAMWLMNGGTIQSTPTVATVPIDWVIQGLSDLNGDTKADILWRQTSTGGVSVWIMDGGTVLSYPSGWTVPTDWVIQPPPQVPPAPTNLTATPASASSINLAWLDNSSNETGFEVERSPNGSTNWSTVATTGANATTYQDTGLASASTYYYRVKANNGGGKSGNSNSANATTSGLPPAAPTGAVATAASASSITLTWQDASANETGFSVERSANGSSGWTQIGTTGANVTSYQNTGLAASTIYYYRVRASNANGNSTYSNTANATTLAATTSVTLAWDDNSTTETGFKVERSPDGTTAWTEIATTGANVTTYQNTGLPVGSTYYYRVRAYTATENSGYSNMLQVTLP